MQTKVRDIEDKFGNSTTTVQLAISRVDEKIENIDHTVSYITHIDSQWP